MHILVCVCLSLGVGGGGAKKLLLDRETDGSDAFGSIYFSGN